jgi:probable HAF family extracellular repeat protein
MRQGFDYRYSSRAVFALAVGCAIALCPTTSYAHKYSVTVLGAPTGAPYTEANAINNAGQVVGESSAISGDFNATLWNEFVPTIILKGGQYGAFSYDINDSGVVAGILYGASASQPFTWSPHKVRFLPVPAPGFNNLVFGINDAGQIVGSTLDGPALWESPTATEYTALSLVKDFDGGTAWGINATGTVVGISYSAKVNQATLWKDSSATPRLLEGSRDGIARRINARGWSVGSVSTGSSIDHAALWELHSRAFMLPDLSGVSEAFGINSQGDVVGLAVDRSHLQHAVVWTHKHFTLVDLNTEIGESEAKEIYLTDAQGINDHCMIVANGYNKSTHVSESYVLSLVDPSDCSEP